VTVYLRESETRLQLDEEHRMRTASAAQSIRITSLSAMIHTGMKWPNGENAATARSLWQELLVSMNQSIDYPSSVNSAFTRFSQTHCSRHDQGLRHQSSNRLPKPEREEHCSTLVGLASALLQNIIPIRLYLYLYTPAQAQEAYMFPWWDSTPELTLCGDVVWCDVAC
jgi:hypothetical protein